MHWLISEFRWAVSVGAFLAIWEHLANWNDTLHVSQDSTRSGKAGDQRPPTPCGCLVCSWRLGKRTSHQCAVLGSVWGTFDSLERDLDLVIVQFQAEHLLLIATYCRKRKSLRMPNTWAWLSLCRDQLWRGRSPAATRHGLKHSHDWRHTVMCRCMTNTSLWLYFWSCPDSF